FHENVPCHPCRLEQHLPGMLQVLYDMTQDGEVEPPILPGKTVAVDAHAFGEARNPAGLDGRNASARDLGSVKLAAEPQFREPAQDSPVARAHFDDRRDGDPTAQRNDVA